MKIVGALLTCLFAVVILGCRKTENVGKNDDWMWSAADLKTRTSPDKTKRVRADVEGDNIKLKFGGVGGDHPVDVWVEHTEDISSAISGDWEMEWLDNSEFVFHHPNLGTKSWTVEGVSPMVVKVKSVWRQTPKP